METQTWDERYNVIWQNKWMVQIFFDFFDFFCTDIEHEVIPDPASLLHGLKELRLQLHSDSVPCAHSCWVHLGWGSSYSTQGMGEGGVNGIMVSQCSITCGHICDLLEVYPKSIRTCGHTQIPSFWHLVGLLSSPITVQLYIYVECITKERKVVGIVVASRAGINTLEFHLQWHTDTLVSVRYTTYVHACRSLLPSLYVPPCGSSSGCSPSTPPPQTPSVIKHSPYVLVYSCLYTRDIILTRVKEECIVQRLTELSSLFLPHSLSTSPISPDPVPTCVCIIIIP